MNNYFFLYKATFYYEGETMKEAGVTYGNSYCDAADALEKSYGDTLEKLELELIDEGRVLLIDTLKLSLEERQENIKEYSV